MILGYQDIHLTKIKKWFNQTVDKINHYSLMLPNIPLISLFKKPILKKYASEKALTVKQDIPIKIITGTGCYIEKTLSSLVKSLDPSKPYIIMQPFQELSPHLLNGIHDIKNTILFSPKQNEFHTPLNFFDDVFNLKSIKDIISILAPNENEYQKYLYERTQIEKIKKTVKALFTYLCIQLKKQKDKGVSIDLKTIKSTLEDFKLYQENTFYLTMLEDMNYLPNHTTLTSQVRHFQMTQIVWQIYFSHFILLEKQGFISNQSTLGISLKDLIENKKNYIMNNYIEHLYYHPFNNILLNLINTLLKEQKANYQLIVLSKEKLTTLLGKISENATYKIISENEILNYQEMIQLEKLIKEEKALLYIAHDAFFRYQNPEQLSHFLHPINIIDIKDLGEKHFVYLNNTWEKVDRFDEPNQNKLTQEDYEQLKVNKIKIIDELMSLKEKAILNKILSLPTNDKKPIRKKKI